VPLFGPPNIEKLKAERDIAGLVKAVGYKKSIYKSAVSGRESESRAAAIALGEIGDARAVEPLIALLEDENSLVKMNAAVALGGIGKPAVEPLIAILTDENSVAHEYAARALGMTGDARAIDPLITDLGDESPSVRKNAAWALGMTGDARAVKPLAAALRDKDSSVRMAAAVALGAFGDARAVKPLVAGLKARTGKTGSKDWVTRKNAAIALGKIGDARAVEPLIDALKDCHDELRSYSIAQSVGVGLSGFSQNQVRECALSTAAALVKIGAAAVEPLIAVLNDRQYDHGSLRVAAVLALGEIGDARAVKPLTDITEDEYYRGSDESRAAALALEQMGHR
jgi:HEAT repeat protein